MNSWHEHPGDEIEKQILRGSQVVPNSPAIYTWRLRLEPSRAELSSQMALVDHLRRVSEIPLASFVPTVNDRRLRSKGYEIGGSGLTVEKINSLGELAEHKSGREFLAKFLKLLQARLPAIYTGETDNVRRRVREHIDGTTDFAISWVDDCGYGWDRLQFAYLVLPGEEFSGKEGKRARTALEYFAAQVSLSGYTDRAG